MLGRDKPQCIFDLTAHRAVQRQNQLTFAMIMTVNTRMLKFGRYLEGNRGLSEKIGVEIVRR